MNNQKEQTQQNNPDQDKRYIVGWEQRQERQLVFVWDKFNKRIVFTCNTRDRRTCYPYIKKHYEEHNCVAPKEMRICLFE